jgi:phosphoribosylanthranilate isomerase
MTVEIKICGLTNVEDARLALEAGADWLGFVLYAGSPRGITARRLRGILDKLGGSVHAVGVFVNEPPGQVCRVAEDCGLAAVQLHGDERPGPYGKLNVPMWRAVRVEARGATPSPGDWEAAERYVVDAAPPGVYGGAGRCADWEAAARLAARRPVMLAGGLTPGNVCDAVRRVRPLGVDVSSGVESAPGRKDPAKVRTFIEQARHE